MPATCLVPEKKEKVIDLQNIFNHTTNILAGGGRVRERLPDINELTVATNYRNNIKIPIVFKKSKK